ncbi:MAG: UDP-N-acetylmuramoyl-L-alanine--D-glutamate ligase, partial [Candidatus Paceibacterota bacterium]
PPPPPPPPPHAEYQRQSKRLPVDQNKLLTGIGGGKDSIVSLELLREFEQTGFTVETSKENVIAKEVADIAKIPLIAIERTIDPKLIEGVEGAYSGHIPISAIYAFLGVLQAALSGQSAFVVSNEYSSSFGNFESEGNEVNHQWSKSVEFERIFQTYIRENLTTSIKYFSLLRPFFELRIVKKFVAVGEKYFQTFSSCNRNFTHTHDGSSRWCGECPKCAFAFLMLGAFLPREKVVEIFKKDLFLDDSLLPLFKDILGYGDMKPFDCVGTFDESRVALSLALSKWPGVPMVGKLTDLIKDAVLNEEVFKAQKADTVPSRFRLYGMESALILGYGKEGHATEVFLKERFPNMKISIADQKDNENYLDKQHDFDITIKTPVIPQEKVTRQSTTATQLFFAAVPRSQIIGITGSKGKSTTSTLIYSLLKESEKKVHLVGNIGIPALQYLLDTKYTDEDLFVCELSSYQLEDLDVSPHIAVITSLFPDHLDHHGSLETYYEAKKNILSFQEENDFYIHADGFSYLKDWEEETPAKKLAVGSLPFAITAKSLRGEHMRSNASLAYTVAKLFGIGDDVAEGVINNFVGLPHRLEMVGTFNNIEFYDDSISTTPESTIAGMRAIGNVDTIILGGVDRGYDFTALEQELKTAGVKNIVLFPDSGEHMLSSEDGFNILHTSSMEEAVQFAYAHTREGKACLLSPSAPSYNLFTNFEERGQAFSKSVSKYAKN